MWRAFLLAALAPIPLSAQTLTYTNPSPGYAPSYTAPSPDAPRAYTAPGYAPPSYAAPVYSAPAYSAPPSGIATYTPAAPAVAPMPAQPAPSAPTNTPFTPRIDSADGLTATAPANPESSSAPRGVSATGAVLAATPPMPAIQAPAPPVAVQSSDMSVRLRVLNKTVAQAKEFKIAMGSVVQDETLEIMPKRCAVNAIRTSGMPGAPAKSAALLEIYEKKPNSAPERLFSGWMFEGDPSLTHLEHPYYDIAVLACVPKEAEGDKDKKEGDKTVGKPASNGSTPPPDTVSPDGTED